MLDKFISQCQAAYYQGAPIISNEEYDALVRIDPASEHFIGEAGEVPHVYRMYSLEKKYPGRGDELPNLGIYQETPKLDGCAVSHLYIDGKYVRSLTRGDGIKGRDVTANLSMLVPEKLDTNMHIVQVTGEVCTTEEVQNRRNFASGAVNLKDVTEFKSRVVEGGLIFVAYGFQGNRETDTYINDMSWLSSQKFNTVLDESITSLVECGAIPTDGKVYRMIYNNKFYAAGFTSKYPKGAFAVKEDEEGIWTVLEDVVWQVGGSGKVTPVGIVKEVVIDDAKITRVTLNNVDYMEAIGLTHIGQEVSIIRAGGIIPKVIGVR
ncbi:NAD-dependent DNA ligase [Vibrio phage phi 3]|uniref:DNA ligase (NAD(+)) n=1 Tax=Vibrio phage phi 3 TaxID=1589298 RepID=A0A0B5H306_9CAUD|nr:NAD-dependent DNA ligase [Vibrio phage phi 3]AJF40872.1 hypothetical protein SBVP3_00105 [Vibrio phage phi 3]